MTNVDRIHILREQDEAWMRWAAKVMAIIPKCTSRCVYYDKEAKEIEREYKRLRDMVQNMFTPDVVYPDEKV